MDHLGEHPEYWKQIGNLQWQLRRRMLASYEKNAVAFESIQAKLNNLRSTLEKASDSSVEKLLIDQILTGWMDVSVTGSKLAALSEGNHSQSSGTYWDRRYHTAHARLLRSIEMLARVRKLGLPSVQINVAEKQINVAQA